MICKCPLCGGDEGYEVSQIIKHIELKKWGDVTNPTIHVDSQLIRKNKTAVCLECRKRINIENYELCKM